MAEAAKHTTDPVLEEEQAHLSETYAALEETGRILTEKIATIQEKAAADKHDLGDEITLNATSFDEALETWAAFAAVNRVIDEHNLAIESAASKLSDIQILLRQPYFAKIVIERDGQEPRGIYIGTVGMTDEDYQRLVVDWRSPVAEVYYNQANGLTSYEAHGKTIDVDLKLRRQFDIVRDELRAYFDTTLAIEDPMLWEALSSERSSQMKAITTTIQREQNTVIRHGETPALLVSGVAGSGKTSVLMQRIAYLFYQHRDDLRPEQVFLLTPNPVFRRYIANVLPELGESNPIAMTWRELAESLLPAGMGAGKGEVPLERLRRIEEGIEGLQLTHKDYRPLAWDGEKFVTANQVDGLMAKFKHVPMGPRRITLVREELVRRFEQKLARMAATDAAADEVESLTIEEQLRLFHETIAPQNDEEMRHLALTMLEDRYAPMRSAIERDEWLRIDRIGMQLLDATGVSPLEWLFTNMCLTGLSAPDIRYVMVDEVQDYTPAQLLCLLRYFRRADFMLLGDENQALGDHGTSFDEVAEVFRAERGQVDRCDLMISYRSTPQIMELFASLAAEGQAMDIRSVHPDGAAPLVKACPTDEEHRKALAAALEQAREAVGEMRMSLGAQPPDEPDPENPVVAGRGLAAVILSDRAAYERLAELPGIEVPLVDDKESLPISGLIALPLELAKGLEFDHVIIPDASEDVYPANDASRRRLYTAISRATRELTILSNGPMTSLLS